MFTDLSKNFVLLEVDSKNGRSAATARFFLQGNQGYVLFLDSQGRELARLRSKPMDKDLADPEAILEAMRKYKSGKQKGVRGVKLLEHLQESTDPEARTEAKKWLGIFKSKDKAFDWWQRDKQLSSRRAAIDLLLLALDHVRMRPYAIQTLGAYGCVTDRAAVALPRLLSDARKQDKHTVLILEQLPKIDPLGKKSLPVIEEAMLMDDSNIRAAAKRVKARIHAQRKTRKL